MTLNGIRTLSEPRPHEIALEVSPYAFEKASELAHYFGDHPRLNEFGEELSLLSAAFITTIGRLPIRSDDFMRWLGESGVFDPAAIAEYAEREFGMKRVTTPVKTARERITVDDLPYAMEKAPLSDVVLAIHERFDESDLAKIVENLRTTLEDSGWYDRAAA